MAGYVQCQATGEHYFTVLTAHFSSEQTKPRANVSTNAAEGIFMVEFSISISKLCHTQGLYLMPSRSRHRELQIFWSESCLR